MAGSMRLMVNKWVQPDMVTPIITARTDDWLGRNDFPQDRQPQPPSGAPGAAAPRTRDACGGVAQHEPVGGERLAQHSPQSLRRRAPGTRSGRSMDATRSPAVFVPTSTSPSMRSSTCSRCRSFTRPTSSERSRIMTADSVVMAVAPALTAAVLAEAPGSRIRFEAATEEILTPERLSSVDLVLAPEGSAQARHREPAVRRRVRLHHAEGAPGGHPPSRSTNYLRYPACPVRAREGQCRRSTPMRPDLSPMLALTRSTL